MEIPLQITFRGVDHSDAIEFAIRQRAERLERFCDRITRCHVTIDMPHQHRHRGNHYAIRIEIEAPSGEVSVTRDPSLAGSHKDFQSVVRDAFDAATRQLEDDAQKHRGDVKGHEHHSPSGRVTRLFPGDGYGFLATADGGEVYLHETLAPGDSDRGARAASVHLVAPRVECRPDAD